MEGEERPRRSEELKPSPKLPSDLFPFRKAWEEIAAAAAAAAVAAIYIYIERENRRSLK